MSPRTSRWIIPALAALAVVVVVAVFWQQRPGSSGDDVEPGSVGAGEPGDPGTEPDGDIEPLPDPGSEPDGSAAAGTIGATGFHAYGPKRLAVIYTNGVPECYGSAGTPVVVETADAVTVTIPRIPPENPDKDVACIDIALVGSVDVTLSAPLGEREVRDGARDGALLPRQSLPDEDPAL